MLPNGEKLIFVRKGQPRKMRLVAQFWNFPPHPIPSSGGELEERLFVCQNECAVCQFAYEIAIHFPLCLCMLYHKVNIIDQIQFSIDMFYRLI